MFLRNLFLGVKVERFCPLDHTISWLNFSKRVLTHLHICVVCYCCAPCQDLIEKPKSEGVGYPEGI